MLNPIKTEGIGVKKVQLDGRFMNTKNNLVLRGILRNHQSR